MNTEVEELVPSMGGETPISSFKSNLEINFYHSLKHFREIFEWLDTLGLGCEFYLRHFTIHSDETVLFAKI